MIAPPAARRVRALLGAGALLGVLFARPTGAADVTEWIMASVAPDGSPSAQLLAELSRSFERASGGRIKVKERLGGVLGDEITTFGDCQKGRVQVWAGSVSAAEASVPGVTVLDTPYLVADLTAYERGVRADILDGPLAGRAFRAQGLVPYVAGFVGWRSISTREKPVRVPADLRGLRMRSLPSALHISLWRHLGAVPKVTALTEVLSTFREKLVDAVDLQVVYLFATSLVERLRHHTRTGHMAQTAAVVIHKDAFGRLSKRGQGELLRLRAEWAARSNKVHGKLEDELVEAVRAAGVQVIVPTAAEQAAWRLATAPLAAEALRRGGPVGAEILRTVQARP